MKGTMLLHSQEDADRAAERAGTYAVHRSGRPSRVGTSVRGNQHKKAAQRRKAERLFGILQTADIRTEADFVLVDEEMWEMAAGVAGKEYPSPAVREMVGIMYERHVA